MKKEIQMIVPHHLNLVSKITNALTAFIICTTSNSVCPAIVHGPIVNGTWLKFTLHVKISVVDDTDDTWVNVETPDTNGMVISYDTKVCIAIIH